MGTDDVRLQKEPLLVGVVVQPLQQLLLVPIEVVQQDPDCGPRQLVVRREIRGNTAQHDSTNHPRLSGYKEHKTPTISPWTKEK